MGKVVNLYGGEFNKTSTTRDFIEMPSVQVTAPGGQIGVLKSLFIFMKENIQHQKIFKIDGVTLLMQAEDVKIGEFLVPAVHSYVIGNLVYVHLHLRRVPSNGCALVCSASAIFI